MPVAIYSRTCTTTLNVRWFWQYYPVLIYLDLRSLLQQVPARDWRIQQLRHCLWHTSSVHRRLLLDKRWRHNKPTVRFVIRQLSVPIPKAMEIIVSDVSRKCRSVILRWKDRHAEESRRQISDAEWCEIGRRNSQFAELKNVQKSWLVTRVSPFFDVSMWTCRTCTRYNRQTTQV